MNFFEIIAAIALMVIVIAAILLAVSIARTAEVPDEYDHD